MASTANLQLRSLRLTGTVDITKLEDGEQWSDQRYIILMIGPTGAGKSSFVEALLGPNSALPKLSSEGLEGYTTEVSAYRVLGLEAGTTRRTTLYLIDTPGFADDRISALEIVSKVQRYISSRRLYFKSITYIAYFTPITRTRFTRSQRQVLKMVKALAGLQSCGGLTIVTTMWDTISGEQGQERAETNFKQLNNVVWKEYVDAGTRVTKFSNTQASAIQILDLVALRSREDEFHIEVAVEKNLELSKTSFAEDMYEDLVWRIQALRRRKGVIMSDLADLTMCEDEVLKAMFELELKQLDESLVKFETQLIDLCPKVVEPLEKKGRMTRIRESTQRFVGRITGHDGAQ